MVVPRPVTLSTRKVPPAIRTLSAIPTIPKEPSGSAEVSKPWPLSFTVSSTWSPRLRSRTVTREAPL